MRAKTPAPPIAWLLEGPAYIAYRTHLDLLGAAETDAPVQAARRALLADPAVQALVAELANWPGKVIASHKSASQPFHKLTFLADLGLKASDPGMEPIITRILAHRSSEGPFALPMNIPVQYGGSGEESWAWALCDAPLVLYALLCFGLAHKPEVAAAAQHLLSLARADGWPCAVSKELGSWHGPGRRDDPCPFATLAMLKALAVHPQYCASPAAQAGAEALLSLWSASRTRHPYIFYMGDDFRKLKLPFIWYDLLHVLDVLTRFPFLHGDPRLKEMLAVLFAQADASGQFTPDSVWQPWKDWEFGQKKRPSRALTFAAWRILQRAGTGAPA